MNSTYTINNERTARTLNERIAEIAILEKKSKSDRYSDGSELIPAEVQASMRRNGDRALDTELVKGYTVNDEGLIDTYTIEPAMYIDETDRAGFTPFAEKLNGRLAMIGFVSLLAMEVITGHGLIWWLTNV
jgi:hypothetical protein